MHEPESGDDGPGHAVTISYGEALAAIQARGRFGIRLGLGRTRALLRALDHPEAELRGALVGGTNGKGSVLALAGSVLRAAGYRRGETPKPHLVSYRARLQVDAGPIDPASFAVLVDEVLPLADRVATATITASQRNDVLLVPNSALRFSPTASTAPQPGASGGIVSSLLPRFPRCTTRRSAAAGANTAAARQVYVLRDGGAVPVSVMPGISDGRMTEVAGGDLQAGMQVITDQKFTTAK